jgi:hypothetical protein
MQIATLKSFFYSVSQFEFGSSPLSSPPLFSLFDLPRLRLVPVVVVSIGERLVWTQEEGKPEVVFVVVAEVFCRFRLHNKYF